MLKDDIIQPSMSPWSAPIWVVPKKLDASGQRKWRVVIDYRKLNDITIGDSYPIPNINEILDQLGKSKYFSTLDLASGFHQIQMSAEDAPKTAFSIPQGHFEFKRMPFGLKNAPSTFQRLMNSVLSGLQGTRCFVYLDDIVIYSYDLDSHMNNLESVFKRLREFNLKLQPDKCEFLRKEVSYLGHLITDEGVKPDPAKIRAVSEFPVPKCPKDVKSFLGLMSYYRKFIPEFSKTAKSLTSLLKKDTTFTWNNEQQLAFETLKNRLISPPLLIYPDFTKPFTLTCDASNYAISAILSQGDPNRDKPIAYASRTLNKSEINYNVTEKELLAIMYGCKTFRPYLYGQKFKIITDHNPLKWLFNHKDPSSKMQRWRLKLEEYDYEITHKKGKLNSAADALSRYPVNPVRSLNNINSDPIPVLPISDPLISSQPVPEQNPHHSNTSNSESPLETLPLDGLLTSSPFNPDDYNLPSLEPLQDIDLLPNSPFNPENEIDDRNLNNNDNINPPTNSTPNPMIDDENLPRNPSINLPSPEPNCESYTDFLKTLSNNNHTYNTKICEHANSLLSTDSKIIVIPTSIDLDETNPYIEEILNNQENISEFLNEERTLHSFLNLNVKDKSYYFLFTKVYHFDTPQYPQLFKSLQNLRNHLLIEKDIPVNIAISDFNDPFFKPTYSKIYNILAFLFHNTDITIKIYKNSVVFPAPSEISKILKENHDLPIAGHVGTSRMYNRIKEKYHWKNMKSDIENYVKKCIQCQTNKALRQINRQPMQITSSSTAPFQRIALDIVGPLPETGQVKLKYILTLQDDLTKYSTAYPISNASAEECCECLIHFISLFGIPKIILTDQGTNFTADLFKKTCEFLKIKQLWSSPYHPQTQGALERSHSTLKEYLKSYVNENQTNWHKYVYTYVLAYNTNVHTTTKFTPYELLFGHKPYLPDSIYDPSPSGTYHEYVKMLNHRLKLTRDKALENIQKSKENSKTYYDRRSRPSTYKIGDMVYLKNHLRLRKALSPLWKGPYKVVKIHGNHTLSLLINRRHVRHHYDEIKHAEVET
ncbi:uncharacterized protein LOC134199889 [Bombyx mori]|uniref:uncharacterized protein LOC134199889 n=1 Tax=Bombyx mori TaxID=7091 RepID=UPI002ED377BC